GVVAAADDHRFSGDRFGLDAVCRDGLSVRCQLGWAGFSFQPLPLHPAVGREAEGGAGEDADANPTVSQVANGPETDSEGIDGGLGEAAQRIAYTA
ncbi:hypothetical protein, partial [Streptomyces sp. NPDC002159]